MSTWHYTRNGVQQQPVTADQLKQLAASGQLQPTDMIWKDGMTAWQPASKLSGLFPAAPVAQAPAAAAAPVPQAMPQMPQMPAMPQGQPGQIGYFSPTSDFPPRAAAQMRGFPAATGPREWPLNDVHMAQLKAAAKIRRPIRTAAGLYKLLFALMVIAVLFIGLGLLMSRRPMRGVDIFGAVPLIIVVGLTVLYAFCWQATHKCHRWAPLTMGILFSLNLVLIFGSYAMDPSPGALVGVVLASILPAIFAAVSFQAFAAIPKFLQQPTWCQEVLIGTGL